MIVVFGSINVDLVARVARLPVPGETVLAAEYVLHPGGKGANQALAAALAGARVALIGAVGRDAFAEHALRRLLQAGIDLSGVAWVNAPTGLAMIPVDPSGENQIVVASGANAHVAASALTRIPLGSRDTLLLQLELDLRQTAAAAAWARAQGARVILNAAPFARLPDELNRSVDLLVVNEGEAVALASHGDLDVEEPIGAAEALGKALGGTVVLTAGPDGAFAFGPAGRAHVPALPLDQVVDTTGAGDTLCGVLAAGLDRGLGLMQALREGVVAAGLACTREGAQSSMPGRSEIDGAIAEVRG